MSPSPTWQFSRIAKECFEDSLHATFSQVRVHFNQLPSRYGAVAFASGSTISLLPELADANNRILLSLLAHELTHVVQQRALSSGIGVLRNRELEAEAQSWEQRIPVLPQGTPLFTAAADGAPAGPLIQCASAAFGILDAPASSLAGGLQYFKEPKLKTSFREAIENYVRLVRPGEVGISDWESPGDARKKYVKALFARFEKTPYLLKELIGDKKVAFDDLTPADRRWVLDELYRAWDTLRQGKEMHITTRLCLGHTKSWLDFRTQDCVFAAILHTLIDITEKRVDPTKVKGRDSGEVILEKEATEAALESWLANYFGVARAITPDVQIIHLLESELGWKNMSDIKTFGDLKGGAYRGKSYIVSYEKTPGTKERDAFWHTVYVDILGGGSAKVFDRQATGMGASGAIHDSCKCDAWLISKDSTGYQKLKRAFDERT